jgi:hypothetical protein
MASGSLIGLRTTSISLNSRARAVLHKCTHHSQDTSTKTSGPLTGPPTTSTPRCELTTIPPTALSQIIKSNLPTTHTTRLLHPTNGHRNSISFSFLCSLVRVSCSSRLSFPRDHTVSSALACFPRSDCLFHDITLFLSSANHVQSLQSFRFCQRRQVSSI